MDNRPSPPVTAPAAGDDGFHHPASEDELVALVRAANREGRLLRVARRGAFGLRRDLHRPAGAPQPRQLAGAAERDGNVNVMLDRYRGWRVKDEARKLVEAEAGIHLGADPSDPTRDGDARDQPAVAAAAAEAAGRCTTPAA